MGSLRKNSTQSRQSHTEYKLFIYLNKQYTRLYFYHLHKIVNLKSIIITTTIRIIKQMYQEQNNKSY